MRPRWTNYLMSPGGSSNSRWSPGWNWTTGCHHIFAATHAWATKSQGAGPTPASSSISDRNAPPSTTTLKTSPIGWYRGPTCCRTRRCLSCVPYAWPGRSGCPVSARNCWAPSPCPWNCRKTTSPNHSTGSPAWMAKLVHYVGGVVADAGQQGVGAARRLRIRHVVAPGPGRRPGGAPAGQRQLDSW